MNTPLRNTIDWLRLCQRARAAGHPIGFCSDPSWLVNQAINRRAGWPDDPSGWRGSAMPVNGHYPKKAEMESFRVLCLIAREINTPRLIVRETRLGQWRKLLLARIPQRITKTEDEI